MARQLWINSSEELIAVLLLHPPKLCTYDRLHSLLQHLLGDGDIRRTRHNPSPEDQDFIDQLTRKVAKLKVAKLKVAKPKLLVSHLVSLVERVPGRWDKDGSWSVASV